jgi:hypothetical protein
LLDYEIISVLDVKLRTWEDSEDAWHWWNIDPARLVLFVTSSAFSPVGEVLILVRRANEEA